MKQPLSSWKEVLLRLRSSNSLMNLNVSLDRQKRNIHWLTWLCFVFILFLWGAYLLKTRSCHKKLGTKVEQNVYFILWQHIKIMKAKKKIPKVKSSATHYCHLMLSKILPREGVNNLFDVLPINKWSMIFKYILILKVLWFEQRKYNFWDWQLKNVLINQNI